MSYQEQFALELAQIGDTIRDSLPRLQPVIAHSIVNVVNTATEIDHEIHQIYGRIESVLGQSRAGVDLIGFGQARVEPIVRSVVGGCEQMQTTGLTWITAAEEWTDMIARAVQQIRQGPAL